jgi:tetratricopeptide (TPR) repeat protein
MQTVTTILLLGLLVWPLAGQAQMFRDSSLDALYASSKLAELEREGVRRSAADPQDREALLARMVGALQGNDGAKRLAIIERAQACVGQDSKAAVCHYVLGVTLGVQAMSEGLLKAAGSLGTVKGSLVEALNLAPDWFPARSAALEFYLQAPGLAGGSTSKAQEAARTAPKPEQVKALQARVLLHQEKPEEALKLLADLRPVGDSALSADVNSWGLAAGSQLIGTGQSEKAKPFFERLQREQPGDAAGPYFLGRILTEAGAHEAALKLLLSAAKLRGADQFPIDYRAGIAQQALGLKDDAKASFTRFVSSAKGQKKSVEDAKARLAQLG